MKHLVENLPEHGLVLRQQLTILDSLKGLRDDVVFVLLRLGLFKVPSRPEDGDDGPEAELVVRLGREEAVAQVDHGRQLLGQDPGLGEPLGAEDQLGDQAEVGVGHGHWPEQDLEVVRQVLRLRLEGLCRHQDGATGVDLDVRVLEHHRRHLGLDGALDALDLVRDHRQSLKSF